jgi:hypothetical protein
VIWFVRLGLTAMALLWLYGYRHPEELSRPWWARGRIPVPVIRYFTAVAVIILLGFVILSFFADITQLTVIGDTR